MPEGMHFPLCQEAHAHTHAHHITDTPPETNTLSELTDTVLTIAWCPEKFCMKFPSGNFHTLILSGAPEAKQNLEMYM